mgnify:CR=1 FL=1|jgi:hypothetical protein
MRINSSSKRIGNTAKKKNTQSKKSFSDIIIVGDNEEKADLVDIEEVPGTRGAGESVLNAKGEFIYDIDFIIDAEDAIAESVTAVEITVFRKKPSRRSKISGKSQKDVRDAFKRKKKHRSKRFDSEETNVRSHSENPVAVAKISLGEEFKHAASLRSHLEKINSKLASIKEVTPEEEVLVRTASPKEDSQNKNIRVSSSIMNSIGSTFHLTKLSTPSGVSSKSSLIDASKSISKKASLKKSQKSGISPLKIGNAFHPVMPLFLSISKDSSVTSDKSKNAVHRKIRKFTVKNTKRGRSAVASKSSPRSASQDNQTREAQRSFITNLNKRKDHIEESLGEIKFKTKMIAYSLALGVNIKRAGLLDSLYMNVRLIHNKNTPGQSKGFYLNHKEQVDEMLTPDVAPDISAGIIGNKPNEVRIRISQNDDIAASVMLLRRKITEDTADPEYQFMEIAQIDVHAETGSAAYIDNGVTNVHPVSYEYRAVPVGPTGSEAPECTASIIVKGVKPIGIAAQKYANPDNNVAMSAVNKYDRVGITVESIPDDVVAIRLFREDLKSDSFFENSENMYRQVVPPGTKTGIIEVGKGLSSVYVEDDKVVPDRTYRYKCTLRRVREPESEANEEEVIHYIKPRARTPVLASIDNIQTRDVGARTEVGFDLNAEFTDPGLELLGDIFAASGVSGNFIEDIRKNRDQLKDVPAFLITRVDLFTGRATMLGIFAPGEFNDNLELQKKIGAYMIPGRKYRYIAKLSLRPPEAFFKNALTNISVQNKSLLGLSETDRYEVLAQRFMSGFGATSGLASDTELTNMSEVGLIGQFEIGKTGIELDETITTAKRKTQVLAAAAIPRKRFNFVEWKVEGDPFDINFYVVSLNYKGSKGVIGTIPSTRSSTVSFRDKLYFKELGALSYSIMPVYNNMKAGKALETNIINRKRDISSDLLDRMILRKSSGAKRK